MDTKEFFTEYGEANRYTIKEVIGKGSYGVVCSAVDIKTGEKVAIKKINNVFDHVSDATRILREIKLLRLLRHPDIVEIKHIMLPPSPRQFKDIYVVFELMETDLHQVIKANDDLTPEHHQFFLYQMLRGLKYIHTAKVFHRDLKPKNILANSDCKLKLELITDLLGTPSPQVVAKVRNEKARRFLMNMRKKPRVNFEKYFAKADRGALHLLQRMLAFDPVERPTCEEALADPYFNGLSQPGREPSAQPVSKLSFEFERRKLTTDEVRELIYRELLEYHPHMLADYLSGNRQQPSFMYPSAVDNFKRQFAHLEGGGAYGGAAAGMGGRNNLGQATSLPRERVKEFQSEAQRYVPGQHIPAQPSRAVDTLGSGVRNMSVLEQQAHNGYNRMPADAMGRPPVSQQQQLLRSNSFQ
ncbi:hypothetical protein WJX79_006431 [Trebouxia sp. C0005]